MLRDSLPQSKRLQSSSSPSGRGGVTATIPSTPRRASACEFGERWDRLRGAADPSFERLPVLGRNRDDVPLEHFEFCRLDGLAAHEVAEARARLLGCCFENGPLV